LANLLEGRDLDPVRMCEMMGEILAGTCRDVELAALLVALRMKGESSAELAAAAAVLREHMVPLHTGRTDLLDTCGTGGDGHGTFNISTATALVAAGAGVPVVKHGNRAMSSRSGSADVLAALGVTLSPDHRVIQRCLDKAGMAFCLAPHHHQALAHAADVRKRLGVRTLFNGLGPLVNPAGASYQLLGVGWPDWLDQLAGAVLRLDTRHAILVHGRDGLDEVTLTGPTLVCEVRGGRVEKMEWTPEAFGLAPCRLEELSAASPEHSAAIIQGVLAGQEGAPLRVVLANTAAALLAADQVGSLPEGVALARQSIRSGAAANVLAQVVHWSKSGS
jgi:anthranilate phosphoribosyltransferase